MRKNITFKNIRIFTAAVLVLANLMSPFSVTAATKTISEQGDVAAEATVADDGSVADVVSATVAAFNVTEVNIAAKLTALQAQFPEGLNWTNAMKYTSNCTINGTKYIYNGYGCVAFALMFSDTVYGANGNYVKTANCPVSQIEAGDIVRVPSATGGHTYVVLSVDANGATIAEGNYNSSIHWGRYVSSAELAQNMYVLSRA